MLKKILVIILCFLLISLVYTTNISSNIVQDQEILVKSSNYNEEPCNECNSRYSTLFRLLKSRITQTDIDQSELTKSSESEAKYKRVIPIEEMPEEWSWRDVNGKDYTTPLQDQGECGSCWAFAAVQTMESVLKIESDRPDWNPDFSEQDVLSCSGAGTCDGGNTGGAVSYLKTYGVVTEECWPYTAMRIPCPLKPISCKYDVTKIEEFGSVQYSVEEVKRAIWEHGPVTAVVGNGMGGYHAISLAHYDENGIGGYPIASRPFYWMKAGVNPDYSLFLDTPVGGEYIKEGDSLTISWTATDFMGNVQINYSTDGGESYQHHIATVPVEDESYEWNVPDIDSSSIKIQINGINPEGKYFYIPYDESGEIQVDNDDDDDDGPSGFFELLLQMIIQLLQKIFNKNG